MPDEHCERKRDGRASTKKQSIASQSACPRRRRRQRHVDQCQQSVSRHTCQVQCSLIAKNMFIHRWTWMTNNSDLRDMLVGLAWVMLSSSSDKMTTRMKLLLSIYYSYFSQRSALQIRFNTHHHHHSSPTAACAIYLSSPYVSFFLFPSVLLSKATSLLNRYAPRPID